MGNNLRVSLDCEHADCFETPCVDDHCIHYDCNDCGAHVLRPRPREHFPRLAYGFKDQFGQIHIIHSLLVGMN